MKLKLRIYLNNDKNKSFMGIGVLWLLEGIKEHGSIRKAASEMDMSYTKAFNILKSLEESLGKPILYRNKGGNAREGTTLTDFGLWFINRYKDFNKTIEEYSNIKFENFCLDLAKKISWIKGN